MTTEETLDKWQAANNDHVLSWCKRFLLGCYKCKKCGLLTWGKATSYHRQVHGEQEIYWEPTNENMKLLDQKRRRR